MHRDLTEIQSSTDTLMSHCWRSGIAWNCTGPNEAVYHRYTLAIYELGWPECMIFCLLNQAELFENITPTCLNVYLGKKIQQNHFALTFAFTVDFLALECFHLTFYGFKVFHGLEKKNIQCSARLKKNYTALLVLCIYRECMLNKQLCSHQYNSCSKMGRDKSHYFNNCGGQIHKKDCP